MSKKKGFCCLALLLGIALSASHVWADEQNARDVTYSVGIKGMTCLDCATHVKEAFARVPGFVNANVDYKAGHAWVTVRPVADRSGRPVQVSPLLTNAVKQLGYQPTVNYVLTIQGMTCDACAGHVREAIAKVRGVAAVSASFKGGYAVVTPAATAGDLAGQLMSAVESAGYKAVVHSRPSLVRGAGRGCCLVRPAE